MTPGVPKLEWELQCKACVHSMGLGRRLLTTELPSIRMVLGGCTRNEVLALFPDGQLTLTNETFWEVVLPTTEPQRTMRDVQAKLTRGCVVMTRPRLLYQVTSTARRVLPTLLLPILLLAIRMSI